MAFPEWPLFPVALAGVVLVLGSNNACYNPVLLGGSSVQAGLVKPFSGTVVSRCLEVPEEADVDEKIKVGVLTRSHPAEISRLPMVEMHASIHIATFTVPKPSESLFWTCWNPLLANASGSQSYPTIPPSQSHTSRLATAIGTSPHRKRCTHRNACLCRRSRTSSRHPGIDKAYTGQHDFNLKLMHCPPGFSSVFHAVNMEHEVAKKFSFSRIPGDQDFNEKR
ncbi:hypothetical protein BDN67DRAFT_1005049 [Paxillus ammoniavirescens]|nr:hypothetical protein BDN67DRAFT_1005049 [Paxillus ammoniavirescens]